MKQVSGSDDFRVYCWRLPKSFDKNDQIPYSQRWKPYTNELIEESKTSTESQNNNNNNNHNNNNNNNTRQSHSQQSSQSSSQNSQPTENVRSNIEIFTTSSGNLILVNSVPTRSSEVSSHATKRRLDEIDEVNKETSNTNSNETQTEIKESQNKETVELNNESNGKSSPISKRRKVDENPQSSNDKNNDNNSQNLSNVPERYKRLDKLGVYVLPSAHCILTGHRYTFLVVLIIKYNY